MRVPIRVLVHAPSPGGMRVRVAYLANNKEISSGFINPRGIFASSFDFTAPTKVQVRVRQAGYIPFECNAVVTRQGLAVHAIMTRDGMYEGRADSDENPAYWIETLLEEMEHESIRK